MLQKQCQNLESLCPSPNPDVSAPGFAVPKGACDSHFHVFGPEKLYPYNDSRDYTPPDASLSTARKMHQVLGIERGVITQPSVYGTDNRATLDALATDPKNLRAVIALETTATDEEIEGFHARGVRGFRLNFVDKGGLPFDSASEMKSFSNRLRDFGWHLEVLLKVDQYSELKDVFAEFPIPVVFGHKGYMKTGQGLEHQGFRDLLDLLERGHIWIKLTGAYRITARTSPPYDDVVPFAKKLIETKPDRMLWGSDWPHPHYYHQMPSDTYLLNQLKDWTEDESVIRKILVTNPESLYGF